MNGVEHDEPNAAPQARPFWNRVQRRYEHIRLGRAGRIIGYIIAFTFISVLLFTVIMVVGYYSK